MLMMTNLEKFLNANIELSLWPVERHGNASGLVRVIFLKLARIPIEVDVASESATESCYNR